MSMIRGVQLIDSEGDVTTIWAGVDPTGGCGLSDFVLAFEEAEIAKVRIFVNASAGTLHIDAVQLLTDGAPTETALSSWTFSLGHQVDTEYDDDANATPQTSGPRLSPTRLLMAVSR